MFHGTRGRIALAAATLIGVATAACSGGAGAAPPVVMPPTNPLPKPPPSSPSVSPSPLASQDVNNARLTPDYPSLDRGLLTYTPLRTLRAGVSVEFNITVIDVGRGAQLTSAPTIYHHQAVDPYDVPTGAEITVQIICASGLTCQSQTPRSSQFVGPGRAGSWAWRLTAQTPGVALMGIMAVTYEKGSDAFVHTTPLWTVALNVQAAAA